MTQERRGAPSIPRSIERGPVEATAGEHTVLQQRGSPFRAQLSAAPLKPSPDADSAIISGSFRAQLSAAPLKLRCSKSLHGVVMNLPRSIERGPVEADQSAADRRA